MGERNQDLGNQTVDSEQLGFISEMMTTPATSTETENQDTTQTETQTQTQTEQQNLESHQQTAETQTQVQAQTQTETQTQQTQTQSQEPTTEQILREEIMRLTALLPNITYPAQDQTQTTQQTQQTTTQGQTAQQTQTATTQQATPSALPETFEFTPSNAYLTEQELDLVVDNPKLLLTAIERAQKDVVQQVLNLVRPHIKDHSAIIPDMVRSQVANQIAVTKAITDFYDGNPDLRQHAQYTQLVMSEVERAAVGTGKTYSTIFEETATTVRKRLGLPSPTAQNIERGQNQRQQKPAFAGTRGGNTGRPAADQGWFDPAAADMVR